MNERVRSGLWNPALSSVGVLVLLACHGTPENRTETPVYELNDDVVHTRKDAQQMMSDIPFATELDKALRLASDFLTESRLDASIYRLVFAENQLVGADASSARWRLGFKLSELIPPPGGKIGKGGDFYLSVDLETGQVTQAKGGH